MNNLLFSTSKIGTFAVILDLSMGYYKIKIDTDSPNYAIESP
jgi:hypothetical protein